MRVVYTAKPVVRSGKESVEGDPIFEKGPLFHLSTGIAELGTDDHAAMILPDESLRIGRSLSLRLRFGRRPHNFVEV